MKAVICAAVAAVSILASPAYGVASPPAPAVVVHISNFAFKPADVTIAPGQSVEFINDDQVAHTVTAADKSFDSGDLPEGKSWAHSFAAVGTFKYACAYHPSMAGTITVKE